MFEQLLAAALGRGMQSKLPPLVQAVEDGNPDCVQMWLDAGIDANQALEGSQTALFTACFDVEKHGMVIIQKLLTAGADVNIAREDGVTALHIAAEQNNPTLIKALLKADANTNTTNHQGRSAFHYAAQNMTNESIDILWDISDVHKRDNRGITAFQLAAVKGNIHLAQRLLDTDNIDINAQDLDGRTALHYACQHGQSDMVTWLLENDADIHVADTRNDITPAILAAETGSLSCLQQLHEAGEKFHHVLKDGNSLLMCAAYNGYNPVGRYLLENDVNIDHTCHEKQLTALMIATGTGDMSFVQILLEFNADLSVQNAFGHTALDIANKLDHFNIAQALKAAEQKKAA